MRISTIFKTASIGVVCALSIVASAPVAFAGPNDNLYVGTRSHVDAPKVSWDKSKGNFTLVSEIGGHRRPLEKTVNWVGKGYHTSGSPQQYIYPIPSDPQAKFLGKAGDLLYYAPAVPGSSREPIWAGFGATADIPAEDFRDSSFTLDIVAFDGPGRMELFNYSGSDFPVERLLSSHEVGRRSAWIEPGNHTHNETTFTRPGQYKVSFRATARSKQTGRLIASAPQTLVWQVGGTRPSEEGLGDIGTAFNKARATGTNPDFKPVFKMHDHVPTANPKDGDNLLTDLVFETGNADDDGWAIFYIDGYYLAEVPVESGQAIWPEMIGSARSNFQVVYIPGSKSTSPRWVSAPLSYARTQPEVKVSQSGDFPTPHSQDAPTPFDLSERTLSNPGVTVSVKRTGDDDKLTITATPADPTLTFLVRGGYYASPKDKNPVCLVNFLSTPQARSQTKSHYGCTESGYTLKLELVPHALVTTGRAEVIRPTAKGVEFSEETRFGSVAYSDSAGSGADGSGSAGPDQPGDAGGSGGDASDSGDSREGHLDKTPVTITYGHLDIGPRQTDDGLQIAIGDDSREHAKKSVLRDPEAVVIKFGKAGKVTRSEEVFQDKSFDFLGGMGQVLYALPQTQQQNLPWPGFSTEALDGFRYPSGISLDIVPKELPDGAKWWAFTQQLGHLDKLYAASDNKHTLEATQPTHLHLNWVFTKPGTYKFTVAGHGSDMLGNPFRTDAKTVTFLVDDRPVPSVTPIDADAGSSGTAPAPKPSPTPGPNPKPQPQPGNPDSGRPSPGNPTVSKPGTVGNAVNKGHGDAQTLTEFKGSLGDLPMTLRNANTGTKEVGSMNLAKTGINPLIPMASILFLGVGVVLMRLRTNRIRR